MTEITVFWLITEKTVAFKSAEAFGLSGFTRGMIMRNKKFEKLSKELDFLIRKSRESAGLYSEHQFSACKRSGSAILIDRNYRMRFYTDSSGSLSRVFSGKELREGTPVYEILPEGEGDFFRENLKKALEGSSASGEIVLDIPGASKHRFTMDFDPFMTEDGEIDGVCLNVSEVTGDKKAEVSESEKEDKLEELSRKITNQNNFMRALLNAIPVPVFFKDRDCRYLGCNQAFTSIMGISSKDLKGKKPKDIWPADFSAVYEQKDLELMENLEMQQYEYKVRDRHGLTRDVIYCKNAFLDDSGQVAGIVGVLTDITERKKVEETLQRIAGQAKALDDHIPICAGCKRIQDREQEKHPWINPDEYIESRLPDIKFSHGMCPECMKRWYPDYQKGK